MGLALARDVPPGTSLAGLCRSIHVIIRQRIYELEYLVTFYVDCHHRNIVIQVFGRASSRPAGQLLK